MRKIKIALAHIGIMLPAAFSLAYSVYPHLTTQQVMDFMFYLFLASLVGWYWRYKRGEYLKAKEKYTASLSN